MTVLARGAGGPSRLHETRAEMLSTLATLSGFHDGPDVLFDGARPDVLLLREYDAALFIGDAKATESPGNAETYERLTRYTEFLASWVASGLSGVFALAVDASDAYAWLRTLRGVCSPAAGARPVPGQVDLLDPATAVIWQGFGVLGA